MTRVPPLTRDQLTPSQAEVYNSIAAGARGGVRGPFTVLLHSPELARKVEQLGVYCRFQCRVPHRQRELAICTVAAHWKADYEWYAHAGQAQKQGVPEAALAAIAAGQPPELDDPDDDAVYGFAQELLRTGRVSDAAYESVVKRFAEAGAVDLSGLLGYYTLLAMTLNAFEVDVPEDAEIPWLSDRAR